MVAVRREKELEGVTWLCVWCVVCDQDWMWNTQNAQINNVCVMCGVWSGLDVNYPECTDQQRLCDVWCVIRTGCELPWMHRSTMCVCVWCVVCDQDCMWITLNAQINDAPETWTRTTDLFKQGLELNVPQYVAMYLLLLGLYDGKLLLSSLNSLYVAKWSRHMSIRSSVASCCWAAWTACCDVKQAH